MQTLTAPFRTETATLLAHQQSISLMRFLSALHDTGGGIATAARVFAQRWPRDLHKDLIERAAMVPGTTNDATWAGPLSPIQPLTDAFLAYVRAASVIDQIPKLRRVPPNISVPLQLTGGAFGWVGQGHPKAATKFDFSTIVVDGIRKAAGYIPVTRELLALTTPGTEAALRDTLAAGVSAFVDVAFTDRNSGGIADTTPASITSGIGVTAPSGSTGQALVADVDKLISGFLTNNLDITSCVLLMTPATAALLASASRSQTLRIDGGLYCGVPTLTSANLVDQIVILAADQIVVADQGVTLDASGAASIQLDSVPADPAVAATVMYSSWQNNTVLVRAERFINWKRARLTAVAVLASTTSYVPGT